MKKPPIRFWIAVMIFFTTFTNYMLRSNISVSVIKMVDREASNFTPPCKKEENKTKKDTKKDEQLAETYQWSEFEVGWIISCYFAGYLTTVAVGGPMAEWYGAWHTILWSSLASAVFTALTPLFTKGGAYATMANRYIVGFFGGVAYPAVNVLIARWAPPAEKGKFLGAMMGNTLGTIFSFNLVSAVTDAWGWPAGFYAVAACMVLFCGVFAIVTADSPEEHRWITEEEKRYIAEAQEGHVSSEKKFPPIFKILLSIPFWISCVAQFGNLWSLNLQISYAPKFMAEVLGFEIKASAGLAALPNLARLIMSNIFGIIGDKLIANEIMTRHKIRRVFIIFSHIIPAACLLLMRAPGCNHAAVVTLLIMSLGFNGAVVISSLVNPQDLAPNYAGTLFGFMNFIGMMSGIIAPAVTGAFNDYYNMSFAAATAIFTLGGGIVIATGVVFILFGATNIQPWNELKKPTEEARPAQA